MDRIISAESISVLKGLLIRKNNDGKTEKFSNYYTVVLINIYLVFLSFKSSDSIHCINYIGQYRDYWISM